MRLHGRNDKFYLGLLAAATIFASGPAFARPVLVTAASGLKIRNAEGEILCAVPDRTPLEASARHADGERLQIVPPRKYCGDQTTGFVSSSFVRSEKDAGNVNQSRVDSEVLSLRREPNLSEDSWACPLPRNTRVTVLPASRKTNADVKFVKIELAEEVPGCPVKEGYVAEAYLKGLDEFDDLPLAAGTQDEDDAPDCSGQPCRDTDRRGNAEKDMTKLSRKLGRTIEDERETGPFLDGVRRMIHNRKARPAGLITSRGLVQIPLVKHRAPCGSFHYLPDEPLGVDAFANPLTACVFTSVLQDWKKKFCPSDLAGCRLSWGDISHARKARFNSHMSHTDGYCIDIRPMREGPFGNSALTYKSKNYDQDMTEKLVRLLRKSGGTAMYFNDTALGTRAMPGHSNHIHVCFKDNEKTRATCDNLKVDPNVCPELQ